MEAHLRILRTIRLPRITSSRMAALPQVATTRDTIIVAILLILPNSNPMVPHHNKDMATKATNSTSNNMENMVLLAPQVLQEDPLKANEV